MNQKERQADAKELAKEIKDLLKQLGNKRIEVWDINHLVTIKLILKGMLED